MTQLPPPGMDIKLGLLGWWVGQQAGQVVGRWEISYLERLR
jgi:hypothetical protein